MLSRLFIIALLYAPAFAACPLMAHPHPPLAESAPERAGGSADAVPRDGAPPISPVVTALITDPNTPEAERRRLMVFHGQWAKLADPTPAERAAIALQKFQLDDPVINEADVPVLTRATAALWRGEPRDALELTRDVAEDNHDTRVILLRAQAYDQLNQPDEAVRTLSTLRELMATTTIEDAAQLTAAAEGLALLAKLEGRPAQDYHLVMNLLAKARGELDRLYWPALIAEARLLRDKDNSAEAGPAILQALQLNPLSSEAWYMLGSLAVSGYDFKNAAAALARLRAISRDNLLADLLEAQILLTQKDPDGARAVIDPAMARHPNQRDLLALLTATEALALRDKAMTQVLAHIESLSPGTPEPYMTVGKYLSMARQYRAGEAMLRTAIERRPNWPEPRIELGLLLMQSGDEEKARDELRAAVALDPFHRRAANQLKLVEELLSYDRIDTDHFTIRFHPGVDRVLARDMPEVLEEIYRNITEVFGHKPRRRTLIEVLPDEQWFGVRITGMPWIWTIGACTGDVIAITPPRSGPKQSGTYDWARVMRHEFVHTVTLDQTDNRVPHWFTEACAVSQEPGGRDYPTYRLLASAYNAGALFELDQINWGFIRPAKPTDRPLAYAQSHWMVEYLTATYGHQAIKSLLALYGKGVSDSAALQQVTGKTAAEFMTEFKAWAGAQVRTWGFAPQEGDKELAALLASRSAPDREQLAVLLQKYPDHPEVLLYKAKQAMNSPDIDAARAAVLRYGVSRPVDPWTHRSLATLALKQNRTDELIGSLEALDAQEQKTGAWSYQLAGLHRAAGRLDAAASSARRALHLDAYNPGYREFAAALELQRGRPEAALHHLESLALLEPDKAPHYVRLAALFHRLGRREEARVNALRARELDPKAPVDVFLDSTTDPATEATAP